MTTWTFAELAEQLGVGAAGVRLVGVDGLAGSGKTTFAERLSVAGGWPVVHTDDFASHDDFMGWGPRFLAEVLEPLTRNEPATYRPYDWVRREAGEQVVVEPAAVVVIEGVGAIRRAWRDRLTLRIWVDAPRDVRLRRGIERDGEELREFWVRWMREEDAYAAAEDPRAHADLVVDGNPRPARSAEEFVLVSERRSSGAPTAGPR